MSHTKKKRIRVYRETMDALIAQKGITKTEFNRLVGHSDGYITAMMQKGYADILDNRVGLWATVLDVSPELVAAIPYSKREQEAVKVENPVQLEIPCLEGVSKEQFKELYSMLVDGFAMIHQDLQMLTDTMHKYWRPEEPRYQVKEREQE